jgi:hypothetical protein
MNDPLKSFKVLVVHPWPGMDEGVRRVDVVSVAGAAVFIVDMLCQGFRAGALGTEIHLFHPSALGTVPVNILEAAAISGTISRPPPPGVLTALDLVGRSHGPNRSQPVPTPGATGCNVVPIDAARIKRETMGGRS